MARLTTCLFTENKQLSQFGPQHLLKLVFTVLSTANPFSTRHLECGKFAHTIDPDETVHNNTPVTQRQPMQQRTINATEINKQSVGV